MKLLSCDSDAGSMRPWHYNLNVASVHVDERRAENLTAYYFPNLYLRHRDKLLGLGHKVRHPGARQKVNVSLYAVSAGQDGYLCHVFRYSFRCSHGLLSSWFWSLHSNVYSGLTLAIRAISATFFRSASRNFLNSAGVF